jgi:SAM-dependent methyltransferase
MSVDKQDSQGYATDIHVPWLILTPYSPKQRVLVIGNESPFIILGLSNKSTYVCVYVCEDSHYVPGSDKGNLIDRKNVDFISSESLFPLPFESGSFDACIARGNINKQNNFEIVSEIFRVLNENGVLLLSLENKFYYKNIRSFFHKNRETKFRLSKIFSELGWFGCFGYIKLLKRNNFKKISCFSFPCGDEKIEILDVGFGKTSIFGRPSLSIKSYFKKRFYVYLKESWVFNKFFGQNFRICASKNKTEKNVIDNVVSDIAELVNSGVEKVGRSVSVTQKGAAVFQINDLLKNKKYVVKIALGPVAEIQLQNNYKNISALHAHQKIAPEIKKRVPLPICKSNYNGYRYFVERKLTGCPATDFKSKRELYSEILECAFCTVKEIHLSSVHFLPNHCSVQKRLLFERIEKVCQLLPPHMRSKMEVVKSFVFDRIIDLKLPMVFHKGDCSANNILVVRAGKLFCNLIDWDQARCSYFPLVDIINVLESFRRNEFGLAMGEILTSRYFKGRFSKLEHALVQNYCESLNMPGHYILPLTVLYWLDHVCAQNFNIIVRKKRWIKNNIMNVLEYLACNLD